MLTGIPMDRDRLGVSISDEEFTGIVSDKTSPRSRIRGHFIKGPLPVNWFNVAQELGGSCTTVGLALWFRWGMKPGQPIKVSHALMKKFKVHPRAGARAVKQLERAGLITAKYKHGASPVVKIIEDIASAGVVTEPSAPQMP